MRLLGSFMFLVGALSVGALAYFPHVVGPHPDAINIVEIEAASTLPRTVGSAPPSSYAEAWTSSPGKAGYQNVADAKSVNSEHQGAATADTAQAVVGGGAWQASVTIISGDVEAKRRSSVTARDWNERVELARNLQSELKRVGCYSGAVDGDWGGASKRAMTTFLQKVNATLPVEAPDYILLTLIQGHADKACGIECPSGQGMAGDGRCISNVIVAHGPGRGSLLARKTTGDVGSKPRQIAATEKTTPDAKWSRATTVAPAATGLPAGPPAVQAKPAAAERHVARAGLPAPAGGQTASLRASIQKAVPQRATAPAFGTMAPAYGVAAAPASTTALPPVESRTQAPVEPLPGRMAIGAPIPAEPDPQASIAATAPQPAISEGYIAPRQSIQLGSKTAALASPDKADAERMQAPTAVPPAAAIAPPRVRRSAAKPRGPSPVYARPSLAKDYRSNGRRNDYATVRTSQGKVRRGSPAHNLMLSLGGVL